MDTESFSHMKNISGIDPKFSNNNHFTKYTHVFLEKVFENRLKKYLQINLKFSNKESSNKRYMCFSEKDFTNKLA